MDHIQFVTMIVLCLQYLRETKKKVKKIIAPSNYKTLKILIHFKLQHHKIFNNSTNLPSSKWKDIKMIHQKALPEKNICFTFFYLKAHRSLYKQD